jgi:citrate lyase subunit beta/citryl-CoA lyase
VQGSVRISVATPEADLEAAIRPGLASVYYPLAESARQVQEADALIAKLEKLRGIRPGTVEIRPLIESPGGVCSAREIAASSPRITMFGIGPKMTLEGHALSYARGECELVARTLDIKPVDLEYVLD